MTTWGTGPLVAAVMVAGVVGAFGSVARSEAAGRAARIEYRNRCGWGDGVGYGVWLRNTLTGQSVIVTVRSTVSNERGRSSADEVHTLAVGEMRAIGCTEGPGMHVGSRSYTIVGEQVAGGGGGSSRQRGDGIGGVRRPRSRSRTEPVPGWPGGW